MPGFIEGLADWELQNIVKQALKPYVDKGELAAAEIPIVERAGIDIANLVAAELLKKLAGAP